VGFRNRSSISHYVHTCVQKSERIRIPLNEPLVFLVHVTKTPWFSKFREPVNDRYGMFDDRSQGEGVRNSQLEKISRDTWRGWSLTHSRKNYNCHYENCRSEIDFVLVHRGRVAEVQRISKLFRGAQWSDDRGVGCGI
jgi:hypothetical protein